MILPGSYANGFAPRDGQPLYPELWRGCVGAWNPGLGPTGLTIRDWSAFKSHGVLTNSSAALAWNHSGGKHCLTLDGSDDLVVVGDSLPLRIVGQISISFWIKTSAANGFVISKKTTNSFGYGCGIASGKLIFAFRTQVGDGTFQHTFTQTATPDLTSLTHVAICYVSGVASTAQIFVNGVESPGSWTTGTGNVAMFASTGSLRFGGLEADAGTITQLLAADIDSIALYSRTLRPKEVSTLATRRGIAYELAPRRRSRVSVLTSLRYNIFTGNVGSLEVIGAS